MNITDLSNILNEKISVFPGASIPKYPRVHNVPEHGYAEMRFTMSSHHGTHIDAPYHIIADGKTLDQFPASKFVGKALKVDCRKVKDLNISKDLLLRFENTLSQIDFLILHTGWSERWGTPAYEEHFPVLSREAAEWLTSFSLKGIGMDTFSIDQIDSADFENHNIVLGKEILIIENLTNLDALENDIFFFSCLPLKIEAADGSPIRAVGW
jgi:arylformamidase